MKAYRRPRETWSADARLDRWHQIWIATLESQAEINPQAPISRGELERYRRIADEYRNSEAYRSVWLSDYDVQLKACRHEVVAALNTLNSHARSDLAHLGLTSCDVTESANQWAIRESFAYVHHRVCILARLIADQVATERDTRMVARTHGQPAQLTTLGYRYATLLEPLNQWVERYTWFIYEGYRNRPQAGAVGTWADQVRVLAGWQQPEKAPTMASGATGSASEPPAGIETTIESPEIEKLKWEVFQAASAAVRGARRYAPSHPEFEAGLRRYDSAVARLHESRQETSGKTDALTRRVPLWDTSYPGEQRPDVSELVGRFATRNASIVGYGRTAESSRQVYHRSQDLHWMGLFAELASIAQTWATDRRLESMLGLGAEVFGDEQVGSSAMPHKRNPRFAERICALAAVTRSHLTAFAELAGAEWLEGDVSTSAARRQLLAGAFENIDALLQNWTWLVLHWEPDTAAIDSEVDRYTNALATGALLQAAVEGDGDRRLSRTEAHECIREAFTKMSDWSPASHLDGTQLAFVLAELPIWPLTEEQTRGVIDGVATEPIGDIDQVMHEVITVAQDRHQTAIDLEELGEWMAELR